MKKNKSQIKIAFVNTFQDGSYRGAEVFVEEVSRRLDRSMYVTVYSGEKKPKRRLPFLWRLYIDPHGLQSLAYTIKIFPRLVDERPDVIIPLNSGWQVLILRVVAFLMQSKIVIAGQSGIGWDDRVNLWTFPNVFVGLTKVSSDWAKRVNPLVRTSVIQNGTDLSKFKKGVRKYRHGLPGKVVLSVGALVKSKRHDKVIDAVARMKNTSLLVAGEGELHKELLQMGTEKLGKRFKIASFSHDEMPRVFKSADAFTYPTDDRESFGIVLVEAMAMGLPIVIGNDPIRKEIVGKDGFYVDVNNPSAYARSLEKALEKKKVDYDLRKYDWDMIVEKYINLLEEITK